MKRSQVNEAIRHAAEFLEANGWGLPPDPQWDVTDFGSGNFEEVGLVSIMLANEPEYAEKLLFALKNQRTPPHAHPKKKKDLVCRNGALNIQIWPGKPGAGDFSGKFEVYLNNKKQPVSPGQILHLASGERVTLAPGLFHAFYPDSEKCIVSEISTASDDVNDLVFADAHLVRFPAIEEDELAIAKLVSDR